jgi:UDP-glucose 4-epimerase
MVQAKVTKVFITGIAGFLGGHLARCSLERGWTVTGIDSMLGGDTRNVPAGARWMDTECQRTGLYQHLIEDADVVFHTAAAPYEGLSVFSPQVVYEHTLMSTVATLRAAIRSGAGRFVMCSSMSRYGHQQAPFTETQPVEPADPYACAKVAAEDAVRTLCKLHGLEWVVAVPHNIYGPGQKYTDPYRNVAAIMINRVLQGKPPVVYGDGSQRRSFSYIDDVTGPLMQLATAGVASEVFNVGPDDDNEEMSILELAQLVLKECNSDLEPEFHPARPAEVHTAACSAAKARRVLGYEPAWRIGDGIAKLAEWISDSGPAPFRYHLPIELPGETTPRTWLDQLM